MRFLVIICIISSIFTVDFEAAIAYLIKNCLLKSVGKSELYIFRALEAGGFHPSLPEFAYQYWSNGILIKIGFKEIAKPKSFRKGDITVTEYNSSHPNGHVAMYTGGNWMSYFIQNSEFVFTYNQPKIHYFRYSKFIEDEDNSSEGSSDTSKICNGKTINQIAIEVIKGIWGAGQERINKLTAVGCDHNTINNEVNKILGLN